MGFKEIGHLANGILDWPFDIEEGQESVPAHQSDRS
jgi:hypothetical protein